MSGPMAPDAQSRGEPMSEGGLLTLAGGLLLGGFVLNALVTSLFHPSGSEDDHPEIFAEYADSDAWVAIHVGQFAGVIIALAGLLVLYRVLEARGSNGDDRCGVGGPAGSRRGRAEAGRRCLGRCVGE